jgi:DNA topoisomerase-2
MSQNLANEYQKKTDREHILDAPDTYIGQVDSDETKNWLLQDDDSFNYQNYSWIPGLFKCFDEGIVNARDHAVRMAQKQKKSKDVIPVKNISIEVDDKTGVITMTNDGNGIDVAKHPEYDLWIPEMIFGHLRTSTNYDKNEKKIVGGKNGFGFKLVLIYSKWGTIETVDHIRKKKYTQRFENNLETIQPPTIKKSSVKPYTKVSWLPDYKRFGIDNLTPTMFKLFKKRTYDIAAVTDKQVIVKFNGNTLPIRTFEQYINMYIGKKDQTKRIFESSKNGRWEYAVCLSPVDEFTHISFVNGISTTRGGKHVEYILKQITKKMQSYIEKKKKIKVKENTIKEQLMLFLNCVVENPSFDSQSKESMNTPVSKFGSKCEVSDKFIDKLAKMGVMDAAISLNEIKDTKAAKKNDGKKVRTIRGLPKLMDANYAGTAKSSDCILILCEGDSAKSGIMSGLTKEDRNYIGVFPLKGKLLNTKDLPQKKINDNVEITNIKKILGLVTNKVYDKKEIKSLRYGKVIFMTDQDLDGSHIKGLCINLFHSQWGDLFKADKFIGFMNTPILKATKGKRVLNFYNESKYKEWKNANNNGKGWSIKYYKGLGTSTSKEFKEYFKNKRLITFSYTGNTSDNAIDKVFNKERADDRKDWLEKYDRDDVLETNKNQIPYEDFVDKEMIHFSKYDCERSIPNLIDGFKTSLRKIIYAAFKKNLVKEIKVAQFSGYVSEHSGYHHGEMSLNKAIVGLAQNYVGSNNINMLMPNGQFGTRLEGGKDAASERYIYTELNPLTKYIFPEQDMPLLNYLDDDGFMVEPDYYLPIIPMVLVNGGKGIGTGYSYEGLCYNPLQIMKYIKNKINGVVHQDNVDIEPYYENFKGSVIKLNDTKFMIKGCYQIISSDSIRITELPIGTWTTSYKEFLESLMDDKNKKKKAIVKSIVDMSTDAIVDITVKFQPNTLGKLVAKQIDQHHNQLEKILKLTTTKQTTNMHLFNHKQQLKKYKTIYDIIDCYFPIRKQGYITRKEYLIKHLEKIVMVLSNKARFIKEQCDDVIDLRKKKKQQVIELLQSRNYDVVDQDNDYKYLRTMTIDSVEEENVAKLIAEKEKKQKELDIVKKKTIEQMWTEEINTLNIQYEKYQKIRKSKLYGDTTKVTKVKKVKKINKKLKT